MVSVKRRRGAVRMLRAGRRRGRGVRGEGNLMSKQ